MSEVVEEPLAARTQSQAGWIAQLPKHSGDARLCTFEAPAAGAVRRFSPETALGPVAAILLSDLLERTRRGDAVAEIRVPFCETKCDGCGCWQNEYRELESSRYADAVVREIAEWAESEALSGAPVRALRIGGGNPTALEAVDLLRILSAARRLLPLSNDCEITLAARAHHFSEDRMEAALAGGVTRFVFSVRSLSTPVRRAIGRVESGREVADRVERLLRYGEASVSVELNYGLPGQSLEVWESDLREASALPLDSLIVRAAGEPDFAGAPAKTFRAAGRELLAAQHALACSFLPQEGWERRTTLDWSRSGRDRALFESLAAGDADRLVFGSGASGRLFGWTYRLDPALSDWMGAVYSGERAVSELTEPVRQWRVRALLARGIRDGRLSLHSIERAAGVMLLPVLRPLLSNWRAAGLLTGGEDWMRFTDAGAFHQSRLAAAADSYLEARADALEELPRGTGVTLRRMALPIMPAASWEATEAGLAAAS